MSQNLRINSQKSGHIYLCNPPWNILFNFALVFHYRLKFFGSSVSGSFWNEWAENRVWVLNATRGERLRLEGALGRQLHIAFEARVDFWDPVLELIVFEKKNDSSSFLETLLCFFPVFTLWLFFAFQISQNRNVEKNIREFPVDVAELIDFFVTPAWTIAAEPLEGNVTMLWTEAYLWSKKHQLIVVAFEIIEERRIAQFILKYQLIKVD